MVLYRRKKSANKILTNKARRKIKLASLVLFSTLLFISHYMKDSRLNTNSDQENYDNRIHTIINVADGDTIFIDWPDNIARRGRTRIRLIGVDTPELGKGQSKDMPYSQEAYKFVYDAIMTKQVTLKLEPNRESRDKYNRLLAYVYIDDGKTMLNEILLEKGMGWPDKRHEHLYQDRFEKLYKLARSNKVGLWSLDNPELPEYFQQ